MDEVLHALRIKGRATTEELGGVLDADVGATEERLRALEADGLAVERTSGRRPGWMLTAEGRDAHAAQTHDILGDDARARLVEEYKAFLRVNDRTKDACTTWQTTSDDARRVELLAELHDVQAQVAPVLERSGRVVTRFGRYGERLAAALERAGSDPRYVVSHLVDSYHTVWFECHEDFLVTLGRDRHDEGSW